MFSSWQFQLSSHSTMVPRYTSPVLSSVVTTCPAASCSSFTGIPRLRLIFSSILSLSFSLEPLNPNSQSQGREAARQEERRRKGREREKEEAKARSDRNRPCGNKTRPKREIVGGALKAQVPAKATASNPLPTKQIAVPKQTFATFIPTCLYASPAVETGTISRSFCSHASEARRSERPKRPHLASRFPLGLDRARRRL
jgi:hypothetical protein